MKTKLIATLMLATGSLFAGPRISIGVGFGVPVAPAPVVVARPAYVAPPLGYIGAAPGPGYVRVNGFYEFVGGRRVWRPGYWRAPAFVGRFRR
jgi:hypothetical protein